jgi:hypothetical protein
MTNARLTVCARCGERLPPPSSAGGRPRRYCSDRCRHAAKKARWAVEPLEELETVVPADPHALRRESLEAVAGLLEGAPAAPPEEQLARALIEQRALEWRFRRLEPDLPPQLAARSSGFAGHVRDGLDHYFEELL